MNDAFLQTNIPFRCVLEEVPTYMALVGRSYFTVPAKSGTLERPGEPKPAMVCSGKNHWQVTRTGSRDTVLYKQFMELLNEVCPELLKSNS